MPPTLYRVNSWNEWDPLLEVVVGIADNACFDSREPGCRPFLRGAHSGEDRFTGFPSGPKKSSTIENANHELQGLVQVLESNGIKVHRPEPMCFEKGISTPMFEVNHQYCATCPRDVMITIGNEIVEATMSRRSRYFESLAYRSLAQKLWEQDKRVTWTIAPKPSMSDEMYRSEFWELSLKQRHEQMHSFEFCVTQNEVVFDAADIVRFGEDLFVQESMTTNRLGIEWLRRHLEQKGFRVHAVHFPLDFFPSHIDCTFVPLRPGLVLTNPDRPIRKGEETIFKENGWELIDAPYPVCDNDEMPLHCQSSKWLSMNLLSLSQNVVICEASEKPLQDFLDNLGFEVIPVPFRNVYEFGGSFHCATWDICREGVRENYFPKLKTLSSS